MFKTNNFTEEGTEIIGNVQIFSEGIMKPYPFKIVKCLIKALSPFFIRKVEIKYAAESRGDFGWYEFGDINVVYINPYPQEIGQIPDIILAEIGHVFVENILDMIKKGDYEIVKENQEQIYADMVANYFLRPNYFLNKIEDKIMRDSFMILKKIFRNHDFGQERKELELLMGEYFDLKEITYEWEGLSDDFKTYSKESFESICKITSQSSDFVTSQFSQ